MAMPMCATKACYTLTEVATMLGVDRTTITRHVRAGKLETLQPITVGARIVFPRAHIDRLVGKKPTNE